MNAEFSIVHGYTEKIRAQIRDVATVIGIDEAYLSHMVEGFYARVRADTRLGPIFEARIGQDWRPHLDRMKSFWASVALNAGGYSGKPVAVHRSLGGVRREDFNRWLELFRATLDDTAPTKEAANYLMIRAERIALSLQIAMFDKTDDGVPALR